jgi:hypothetical protein
MSITWNEADLNGNYVFSENYENTQDGTVSKCPECCVGGSLLSNQFIFNQTQDMNCTQGIKMFHCTGNANILLTFNCNETSLLNDILLVTRTSTETSSAPIPSMLAAPTGLTTTSSMLLSSTASSTTSNILPSSTALATTPSASAMKSSASTTTYSVPLLFAMFVGFVINYN